MNAQHKICPKLNDNLSHSILELPRQNREFTYTTGGSFRMITVIQMVKGALNR